MGHLVLSPASPVCYSLQDLMDACDGAKLVAQFWAGSISSPMPSTRFEEEVFCCIYVDGNWKLMIFGPWRKLVQSLVYKSVDAITTEKNLDWPSAGFTREF